MYERFTDRARRVMQLANQEAQRLNHEYIGTEHILLALIKDGAGVGIQVMKRFHIDPQAARLEVEKIIQPGPDRVSIGVNAQTPRTKQVIEYAMAEARNLDHNYFGTEHLLLGLLKEHEGVAGQVLQNFGLTFDDARKAVLDLIGSGTILQKPSPMNSRILAYLRLLRLPTVFTAMADIFLGFLLTHSTLISDEVPNPLPSFLLLCLASAGLYLSGMVFNDYFDRLIDAQERPNRPIPSGAILPGIAFRLAAGLMLVGLVAAGCVGVPSLLVAVALCVLIVGYDGGLKNTLLGPLVMGSCRAGNVLLGASAVASFGDVFQQEKVLIALGLGTYIVGVTLFARQEATVSRRGALLGAAVVINLGVVALAMLVNKSATVLPDQRLPALGILAMILFTLDRRLAVAIAQPSPAVVQVAIKVLLLSLVVLDATLVYAFNGDTQMAMATVALLIPAVGFSRLIAMT